MARPPSLEEFVALQVRQGTYRSREAAIVAAVSQHKHRTEQRAWLTSKLEQGLKSGSAGTLDVDSVIQRGRRRQSARTARAGSRDVVELPFPALVSLTSIALAW